MLITLSCASFLMAAEEPVNVYGVQCRAYRTQDDTDICKAKLKNLGYGPTWEVRENNYIKVITGKFEFSPDACILRDTLRKTGFPGAFVKSVKNEEGNFTTQIIEPKKSPLVFPTISVKNNFSEEQLDFEIRPELSSFYLSVSDSATTKNQNQIITEGLSLMETLPDTDPAKGWVMNRVGYNIIIKEKERKFYTYYF